MDWFYWLIDTESFVPRSQCGAWTPQLIALYQLANALIALAYFAIPLTLFGLWLYLKKIKKFTKYNPWIIVMFCTFIVSCGIAHVGHVIVFWQPAYRIFALWDLFTAAVSLITAIFLPMVIYDFVKFIEMESENAENKGNGNDETNS